MKTKSKIILYSTVLFVWLALLAGFLIYPLWTSVQEKSARLKQKQKKITEVETQSQQLHNLQQSLNDAESSFATLDKLFINEEAPVSFLEFLEKTANDSDLNINITPSAGAKRKKEPWSPTFFKVSGKGTFKQGVDFIKKLEYAPYLVKIQTLEFNKKEVKEGKININLLIKVY